MGCWNGTCGLSQVAITDGVKVKAVIIKNNVKMPEASGFCYEGGYASPMSFIIECDYDDYGSIENIKDNKAMKLFKEYFINGIKNESIRILSDNYYDNEMFGKNEIDYTKISNKQLMDLLERDRVFLTTSYYDKKSQRMEESEVNIGFMLIHNDIYESIKNSLLSSKNYEYEDFTMENIRQDITFAVEDMFENIRIWKFEQEEIDILNKQIEETSNEEEIEKYKRQIEILKRMSSSKGWESDVRKIGDWYNKAEIFRGGEGIDMRIFRKYHSMLKEGFNVKEKEDIIEMLSEMYILINIMSALRKSWSAQSGKGSQSFEEDAYLGLANGIKRAVLNNREDLTGYEIICTQSIGDFIKDKNYEVISCDYENDIIILQMPDKDKRKITYNEFQSYFEY